MPEEKPWLPIIDPLGLVEKLTENAPIQLRDPLRKILKEGRSPSQGNPDRVTELRKRGYVP